MVLPEDEEDSDEHTRGRTRKKSLSSSQDSRFDERLWIAAQDIMPDTDVHFEDDAADTGNNGEMRSKKDHVVN
jgi:hypothetical protein